MNDHENYVREYKDTVFKIVFQEKKELLALFLKTDQAADASLYRLL